ncbi:putative transmembrane protein [Toxoplasma gondii VEG]|uniref:Transmembrane protein n=2 Tax=Toxoplasma gondii TaxID=5811 RepID=V4ZND7_TOXGV|nr:putative transmembrane protein [Toxoplasma gondii VEG]KFG33062.1 putative transmembrane protein [Toxoplasma gondii p89]
MRLWPSSSLGGRAIRTWQKFSFSILMTSLYGPPSTWMRVPSGCTATLFVVAFENNTRPRQERLMKEVHISSVHWGDDVSLLLSLSNRRRYLSSTLALHLSLFSLTLLSFLLYPSSFLSSLPLSSCISLSRLFVIASLSLSSGSSRLSLSSRLVWVLVELTFFLALGVTSVGCIQSIRTALSSRKTTCVSD